GGGRSGRRGGGRGRRGAVVGRGAVLAPGQGEHAEQDDRGEVARKPHGVGTPVLGNGGRPGRSPKGRRCACRRADFVLVLLVNDRPVQIYDVVGRFEIISALPGSLCCFLTLFEP